MKKFIGSIKMFVLLAVVAVTTITMTACSGSTAKTDWDYIQDKGTLVMGLDPAFPPMGFDDNGTLKGFDIDVAKEVASVLGVTLELKAINWDTKEQDLNTKRIDVIWNGFTMTEARIMALNFSVPYLQNNQVVVVKDLSIENYAGLSGKKIGYQFGSSALDAINGNDTMKVIANQGYDDNVMALNGLNSNQVQAVVMDEVVANYLIATNNNFAGFKVLGQKLAYEEFGIGMRKGDNLLQYKINSALKTLKNNGKLAAIAIQWFGNADGLLV